LPLLALFAYTLYLRFHYGHWDTWLRAQSLGWARSFHWPWEALRTTLCAAHLLDPAGPDGLACSAGYDPGNAIIFQAEIAAIGLGLIITIASLWRRQLADGGWVGAQVAAFSCQVWFISVARASLLWFPLWITIGQIAAAEWRGRAWWFRLLALIVVGLASAVAMIAWAARYFSGAWAG
jgi:hypothetical protein